MALKRNARTTMLLILGLTCYTCLACSYESPAPATASSVCQLPNGNQIIAPEISTAAQSVGYWIDRWYALWDGEPDVYDDWCDVACAHPRGRKMLQSKAPAPGHTSSAPLCCSTVITKSGDTVSSLISNAGLPENAKTLFFSLNPNVKNGTEALTPGTVVTPPCDRITQYLINKASPAPAPATSQASG